MRASAAMARELYSVQSLVTHLRPIAHEINFQVRGGHAVGRRS